MIPLRLAAVICVTTALMLYTTGSLKQQRARRAPRGALGFLTAGVVFDVMATTLMVLATRRAELTLHGALGYTALAAMLADTVLLWRHRARDGEAEVSRPLHLYSRAAFAYWVIAYFTGAALVMGARGAG